MDINSSSSLPFPTDTSVDATLRVRGAGERAVVFGGGGAAGNAWVIGVVAGLFEAGLDVTQADLIIGTSSGSTAAAQVTAASPSELLDAVLSPAPQQRPGAARPGGGRPPIGPAAGHMETTAAVIAAATDAADMRRRMGAAALEADAASDGSAQAQWRATVEGRLPSQDWPERTALGIVAVEAHTGRPVLFDRDSGVGLADAVAASCANGFGVPPYLIGETRYIDGGYRRNENADLAAGYGRVLVLSPLGGRTRHPLEWRMQLDAQVEDLRADGSRVECILPDEDSRKVYFHTNLMDLSTRQPAARAGHRQGLALAGQLAGFWG